MSTWRVLVGDCRESLRTLPDASVQCVVTSPPYWGLRDYGHAGQLGLERTPEEYVAKVVEVFREVRRVMRDDGTLWLNLGDSYAASPKGNPGALSSGLTNNGRNAALANLHRSQRSTVVGDLKAKDLVGIPWRVAFALQQPYYAGSIKRAEDRIWLAAMLDAEGCLFIQKRKAGQHNGQGYYRQNDNYGPGVEIANTSLAVVERIAALVGKGSVCSQSPEQNGRRKQTIYRWNLRTTECREFVREVYPHLIAKRQQARILYGCPTSGERAEAAHEALKALHRSGDSPVDFAEIPSMLEPGWYLRSDVIWSKCNPMPESVTDRPTKAHEYVFLLSKSASYFYDADAIAEPAAYECVAPGKMGAVGVTGRNDAPLRAVSHSRPAPDGLTRNARSVWTIATQPFTGAHFATFPPELAERCILAGTSAKGCCAECGAPWERMTQSGETANQRTGPGQPAHLTPQGYLRNGGSRCGDVVGRETTGWAPTCECNAATVPCTVLDIFAGSGTTGMVATGHGRSAILCELNPEYVHLIRERCGPMLEVA